MKEQIIYNIIQIPMKDGVRQGEGVIIAQAKDPETAEKIKAYVDRSSHEYKYVVDAMRMSICETFKDFVDAETRMREVSQSGRQPQ